MTNRKIETLAKAWSIHPEGIGYYLSELKDTIEEFEVDLDEIVYTGFDRKGLPWLADEDEVIYDRIGMAAWSDKTALLAFKL